MPPINQSSNVDIAVCQVSSSYGCTVTSHKAKNTRILPYRTYGGMAGQMAKDDWTRPWVCLCLAWTDVEWKPRSPVTPLLEDFTQQLLCEVWVLSQIHIGSPVPLRGECRWVVCHNTQSIKGVLHVAARIECPARKYIQFN